MQTRKTKNGILSGAVEIISWRTGEIMIRLNGRAVDSVARVNAALAGLKIRAFVFEDSNRGLLIRLPSGDAVPFYSGISIGTAVSVAAA